MRTINYESDFKLIEGFKDGSSILAAPFRFTYYTKVSRGVYVAEYNGSEFVNCIPTEDGRVIVPFDSLNLGMGQLMVKREFFLNDADFADGVCNLVSVESTGITLDKGATDGMGEINIEVFPFYQQGEAGKSAYDLWIEEGNEGTVADFLASLKGANGVDGANGKSAYQEWLDLGNEGTEEDFLESLKGKGAEIVSSVDDLDPNAPQGSLASVAINTVSEVSFSELHQPTSDEVNLETEVADTTNLSRVSGISVNSSYDTSVEIPNFMIYLFSKDIDTPGRVGQMIVLAPGAAMIMNFATQEQQVLELFTSNEDGIITVNEENLSIINNLLSSTEFVYGGIVNEQTGEFIDPSYADVFYKAIGSILKTDLYIKDVNGWEKLKTGSEVVNNLEEGGVDKALSAEMGKLLNEKIANIVAGNTTEPIKFKGYVNVDNKNGIDKMFGLLSEGEACLVAPSVDTGSGDSYKAWVSSAINQEQIELGAELFKTSHNITVSNVLSGKPLEVKTFLKLDEAQPYCQCPDMILLCKIKVKAKDFVEFVDGIDSSIASIIPDSLMLTACIGKVLRWSAGDWLLNNPDKYSLTHKYGYNTDMDTALESGIIGYTATCTSGMPGGITENYTVIINASSDSDPTFRTIQQIAYGRTGAATNRVWTRILFKNVMGGVDNFSPWVEITKNTNILPNVNGWLLNPSEQLNTGVYQTCSTRYTHYTIVVDDEGKEQVANVQGSIGRLTNNYCTLFVNASTSPNGDGWDAIEQTAYGREADEGQIYRRVVFYNKTTDRTQYKEWIRIDDGMLAEFAYGLEGFITENLTTKEELQQAIENAITKTLNTAV